jgi:hypothetical protein
MISNLVAGILSPNVPNLVSEVDYLVVAGGAGGGFLGGGGGAGGFRTNTAFAVSGSFTVRSAAVVQVELVLQHLLRVLIQFYQRLHQQAADRAEYLMANLALVVVQAVEQVPIQARQQQ